MSRLEPLGVERQEQWRRARRAVARRHHPDVGGSLEAFVEQMRLVDQTYGFDPAAAGEVADLAAIAPSKLLAFRRLASRTRRRTKNGIRTLRSRLPRRVPGSRRYFDI